jgi:glycosyltransferase involved in cell wall biosynthesis
MTSSGPDYSIIIPTYRRRDALARCLKAIEALDFPRDRFELVVVDDGSPVPAADVVASLDRSLDARLVCAPHGGPAAARNTGAGHGARPVPRVHRRRLRASARLAAVDSSRDCH